MSRNIFSILAVLMVVVSGPVQIVAGAPTTTIVVNGPGIPHQGIVITGSWPGGTSFVDAKSGPISEPASELPRYVVAGHTDRYQWWFTVLYVWDQWSDRSLVYLPGPSDLGYRINYGANTSYEKRAGKWYYVSDPTWADAIRKVLPQTSLPIVFEGDPATITQIETILKENPELVVPGMQTKFSMIVVKPDPGVDYKIVQVTPDPSVHYKITILDPSSGKEMTDLSRQFGHALREKIEKKQKESK